MCKNGIFIPKNNPGYQISSYSKNINFDKRGIYRIIRLLNKQQIFILRFSLCDSSSLAEGLQSTDFVKNAFLCESKPGEGLVSMEVTMADGLFYDTLSANTGLNIYDDKSLVRVLGELSGAKKEYDKFAYALSEVNRKGYGIVFPSIDELSLEEPEIIKQGNKFGVRRKASAPSFHIMCNKPKSLEAA